MDTFLQQIVSGLASGGIYAALALPVVMTCLATNSVNFAQGEMAMFSTYLAASMIRAGLPFWAAFFATLLIAFLGGIAIERAILQPLAGDPVLGITIVAIGLLPIFTSLAVWIFSYTVQIFRSPFPTAPIALGGVVLSAHSLGSLAITLALLALLYGFFRYTGLGRA